MRFFNNRQKNKYKEENRLLEEKCTRLSLDNELLKTEIQKMIHKAHFYEGFCVGGLSKKKWNALKNSIDSKLDKINKEKKKFKKKYIESEKMDFNRGYNLGIVQEHNDFERWLLWLWQHKLP